MRRSWWSESDPPYSPMTTSGTSANSPTRPTAAVDPVISYTCSPIATTAICEPTLDSVKPA